MAWVVFLTGCAYYLYQYILRIAPGVLTPDLQQSTGWAAATIGAISAAYFYAYTPMQVPVGVLTDQYGPRKLFLIGTSVLAFCVLGQYFATESADAEILHFLIGFGSSFAYIGTTKLVAEWFPARHFATLIGVISAFGMAGSAFGSNALVALSGRFGVDNAILVLGLIGVLIAVLVFLFVRDTPKGTAKADPDEGLSREEVAPTLGRIVKEPHTWLAGTINFAVGVPTGVIAGFAGVTILMKMHELNLEDATFVNSMIFVGAIFGAPGLAAIAAAMGRRRAVMVAALAASGLCLCALIFVPKLPYGMLIGLFLIIGFGTGCSALTIAMAKEWFDNSIAGMVVAVVNMIGMTAPMLLQPYIAGPMDGSADTLREALMLLPALYGIALFLAIYGKTDSVTTGSV
jgi:MFS family permease